MKKSKRLLSVILSAAMAFSMMPATVMAAEITESEETAVVETEAQESGEDVSETEVQTAEEETQQTEAVEADNAQTDADSEQEIELQSETEVEDSDPVDLQDYNEWMNEVVQAFSTDESEGVQLMSANVHALEIRDYLCSKGSYNSTSNYYSLSETVDGDSDDYYTSIAYYPNTNYLIFSNIFYDDISKATSTNGTYSLITYDLETSTIEDFFVKDQGNHIEGAYTFPNISTYTATSTQTFTINAVSGYETYVNTNRASLNSKCNAAVRKTMSICDTWLRAKLHISMYDIGFTSYTDRYAYLDTPEITSVFNTGTGFHVIWKAVTGASKYRVYYKAAGAKSWTRVKDTTNFGAEIDKDDGVNFKDGTTYYFTVKCIREDGTADSDFNHTGVACPFLREVYLSVANLSTGMYLKWNKVAGASGYCIYRYEGAKEDGGTYVKIKQITSNSTITYVDTSVKNNNGKVYTYLVRAYKGATKSIGNAVQRYRLTGCSITSVTNSASKKATIKWAKSAGVAGYLVQYSTSKTFASGNKHFYTTNLSSVVSGLTKGKTYYFRVRTYKTYPEESISYSAWSAIKSVKISK